jgi:hypothetical protein
LLGKERYLKARIVPVEVSNLILFDTFSPCLAEKVAADYQTDNDGDDQAAKGGKRFAAMRTLSRLL